MTPPTGSDDQGRHELEKALAFLEWEGYQRCDIPACNCGSWHQTRHRPGWSEAKVQKVGKAAFALSDWFNANPAINRPDEMRELMSEVVVADDQRLTMKDIKRTHELIAEGKLPSQTRHED